MKPFFIVVLALFIVTTSFSQSVITITGQIVDSTTQNPVEYASVKLSDAATGKTISGAVSNKKGVFTIEGIAPGTYTVLIESVGFQPFRLDTLLVTDNRQGKAIGPIALTPATRVLQGVTVTSKALIVENKIDKIVYNAANDITSQGGAAIDILKKVPQVTVDIDGNVELQGNNNIRFLINGKPSSMFGSSIADALASIPASQIKSIEAITSPGAKYDAQGTGGIINIILKDNKVKGINGSLNMSAGTRLETGSVNLNYRHNNFGLSAFFNGNAQLRSTTFSTQDRSTSDTAAKTTTRLLQDSRTEFVRHGFSSGISFDYSISKSNELTGSFSFDRFFNRNESITNQQEETTDQSANLIISRNTVRSSFTKFQMPGFDWDLTYKHKFKKPDQELEISYTASSAKPQIRYSQFQNYKGEDSPFGGRASNNPGTDKETEISFDYVHPVTEKFLIELGAKTIFQDIKSNADVQLYDPGTDSYIPDLQQSNSLGYTFKVYGGYLSATFTAFKWLNVKAGARYEYTHVGIDFPNTHIPSYGNLVPSIILSHDLPKDQTIKLAYSKRIERPAYRELNPFLNITDPYNISTGNPLLKPELGNNFELGYNKSLVGGGSLYIALVERINSHDIKNVTTFYPSFLVGDSLYSNVSLNNNQNIGTEYNSGMMLSASVPLKEKFTLRVNAQVSQRQLISPLKTGNANMGVRFRFNLNASYQVAKTLIVETFGNFNSASQNIQGKVPQQITYTIAGRKQFMNKKASIGLTATNPFNKYIRQVTTIQIDNYISSNIRRVPFRSFGISFSYKFGKLEFKKSKNEENGDGNTVPTFSN